MPEAVVTAAARTPFGKFGGALKPLQATDLGGLAIKEALRRAGVAGDQVDEVIMGMVVPAGQGQIPGRQASVKGGVPHSVPALTINKVCGSALKAVALAAQSIRAGDAQIVVAGGMESMSNIPYVAPDVRWGARMNDSLLKDAMVLDGLWCPENDVHMAVIGGSVAGEYGISREQQDAWALRSQLRWAAGEAAGAFDDERFAVEVPGRKGAVTVVDKDEAPRPDTTAEGLAKLPPLFVKDGTVTAGNAPGTNDGASAVVVMSRAKAEELGAPILATIRGHAQAARESRFIATVPGIAMQELMSRHGLTLADFDRIEINEAFAAVPLVSGLGVLKMSPQEMDEKVNVNGSAVAVGHPIGATGARILMTLIYELRRSGLKSGVAAICSGMAQGDAVWVTVD
ncbi:MAG: acetyl-CoA C-acetyltransferase [Propionibacteriaceae bacterium]|jgi:acetyl-CoA C-acetyltransferase|nr:acetyl-CoA C-acetyltransferase [Propionibacteriaceae bacterium]